VNDTMERHFEQAKLDMRHPKIARYLELCGRMQDIPRHLGQHSGGMVICAGMLNRVVPIERASMPGRAVMSSFALRLRIQQLMRGISLAVSMTFFLDTLRAIAVRSEVRSY
jgi:hypothetical protein